MKLLKVIKSDKPLKKWTAIFLKDNGKEKKTHFGFDNINDKERRKRYRTRTINQIRNPNTNFTSASYLSFYLLWGNSTSLKENIKSYKKRFNL